MAKTKGSRGRALKMLDAQARAQELGIDPFEILLLFAAGKWQELGYAEGQRTIKTETGCFVKDTISAELRVCAARDATNYIFAKKKSIEFDIKELPDQAFDQEIERRVHLKILKGEIKASDVG